MELSPEKRDCYCVFRALDWISHYRLTGPNVRGHWWNGSLGNETLDSLRDRTGRPRGTSRVRGGYGGACREGASAAPCAGLELDRLLPRCERRVRLGSLDPHGHLRRHHGWL